MHIRRLAIGTLFITSLMLFAPAPASAGPELTFVLGAMVGDSLTDVLQIRPNNLTEGFENAPIYGGRVGWSAFPFAIEGSLLVSPSAINIANSGTLDARLIYAEAEIQLLILPGPVSPFIGGGLGIHNMRLDIGTQPSETTIGYVLGGGLKAAFGSFGVRVDVKDHITPLDVTELGDEFIAALGIAETTRSHNVEFSGGLTIRF